MIVINILLYILGTILALVLLLALIIMVIPVRYRVQAGYENHLWFLFNFKLSPLFILAGTWDQQKSAPLQARLFLSGIPIKFNPIIIWRKMQREKDKDKENKENKKKGFQSLLLVLDKDLQARGIGLAKDLLDIIKPDLFSLKGRIGFDEPHLTGWLAAVTSALEYSSKEIFVDLEPVWEDEYCEFEALVKGRIMVGVILVKIGWFVLMNRTRHLFSRPDKHELASDNTAK